MPKTCCNIGSLIGLYYPWLIYNSLKTGFNFRPQTMPPDNTATTGQMICLDATSWHCSKAVVSYIIWFGYNNVAGGQTP